MKCTKVIYNINKDVMKQIKKRITIFFQRTYNMQVLRVIKHLGVR